MDPQNLLEQFSKGTAKKEENLKTEHEDGLQVQTSNRSDDGSHLSRDQSNDQSNGDHSDEDSLQIVEEGDENSSAGNQKLFDPASGESGPNRRSRNGKGMPFNLTSEIKLKI